MSFSSRFGFAVKDTAMEIGLTKGKLQFSGLIIFLVLSYLLLDMTGCVVHKKVAEVKVFGIWQDGELRDCSQYSPIGSAEVGLDCATVVGSVHNFEVSFRGPLETGGVGKNWICKKDGPDINCR